MTLNLQGENYLLLLFALFLISCQEQASTTVKVTGQMRNVMWFGDLEGKHKAVFTHHDSFFHDHFISDDRDILGHVDAIDFNSNKVSLSVSK